MSPDPRQMPVCLYLQAEARALEAFRSAPAPPQVCLSALRGGFPTALPVAYPTGSLYDNIEIYFASVEAVLHSPGAEWADAWQIDAFKNSDEFSAMLRHFEGSPG